MKNKVDYVIIVHMETNKWSRKYSCCNKCKTTELPHKALGLCKTCYEASKGYIWQKQYREKNLDAVRKWQRENPHKSTQTSIRKLWMKRLSERDGAKCRKCGTIDNLTIEHKIPRCIGGKNSYENLEILCLKCNINEYHTLVKKALTLYFKTKEM